MATESIPCPACGAEPTRKLTRKELRDRNGGRDPVVVVIPRMCLACQHVWEPPLSRGTCYLVAGIAGVGVLVGLAIFVGMVVVLIGSKTVPEEGANNTKNQMTAATFGLMGLGIAGGSGAMARKYLRLAAGPRA
jgi:hypothetical protein